MKNKRTKDILIYIAVALVCALISGTVAGFVGTIKVGASDIESADTYAIVTPDIEIGGGETFIYIEDCTRIRSGDSIIFFNGEEKVNGISVYDVANFTSDPFVTSESDFNLRLNGWCYTEGGIDSYSIRVISQSHTEDYENLYNSGIEPWAELVSFAQARGYSGYENNCVYALDINLSSFVGETVDVYIIANKGDYGYTVVKIANLGVICNHYYGVNVTYERNTETTHIESGICHYCGYYFSNVVDCIMDPYGSCICGNVYDCPHTDVVTTYNSNNDGSHRFYAYCNMCNDIVSDGQIRCYFISGVCADCGYKCEHTDIENFVCNDCGIKLTDYYSCIESYTANGSNFAVNVTKLNDYYNIGETIKFTKDDMTLALSGWIAMNGGVTEYTYQIGIVGNGTIEKTVINTLSSETLTSANIVSVANSGLNIFDYNSNAVYYLKVDLSEYKDEDFILSFWAENEYGQKINIATFNGLNMPEEETESDTDTEDPVEEIDFDINNDGVCDGNDVLYMEEVCNSGVYVEELDFDEDGLVKLNDYVYFCNAFYKKYPPENFCVGLEKLIGEKTVTLSSGSVDKVHLYNVSMKVDEYNRLLIEGYCAMNNGIDAYTYGIVSDDGIGMSGMAVVNNYSGYKLTSAQMSLITANELPIDNYNVNARFQFFADLSDFVGKTVTITVNAISNDGQEKQILRLTNVEVPDEEESETESDTGTEAPGSSGSDASKGDDKKINTSFIAIIPMAALVIGGIALLDYVQKSEKKKR